FTATIVALSTASGWMGMHRWPWWISYTPSQASIVKYGEKGKGQLRGYQTAYRPITYDEAAQQMELLPRITPWPSPALPVEDAIAASCRGLLDRSGFMVFSKSFVFSVFLSFLLPIWSIAFATDAIGGEREAQSLVWLLTRPLPRSTIYLAKFIAVLPWSLG